MSCNSCARDTLRRFVLSLSGAPLPSSRYAINLRRLQSSHFSSVASRLQAAPAAPTASSKDARPSPEVKPSKGKAAQHKPAKEKAESKPEEEKPKPEWLKHKEAIKEKLNGEAWNPRKKLSPDTMEGIRHLHKTQPHKFTTPVLAQHFQVSPEAIRRILKSKWRPTDEEAEERLRRWDKRGERIWSNLVELGVKPPKKWREMGVGRAGPGQKPIWKSRPRNTVPVNTNTPDEFPEEDIIPIVDGRSGKPLSPRRQPVSLSGRIL